jgi:hypothetical protein
MSRFHVLRARTHFRRYRGRPLLFSCFALPNMFSALPWASAPVFKFCAPKLVCGGTNGVESRFHVLHSQTHFRWCGGRQIRFSCFALSDSFSAVPRASGPVSMFCAPVLIFGDTGCDVSRFHVLRSRTYDGTEGVRSCFHVCTPGLIFDGTEDVGSRFHVLRARTHIRQYRGRRLPYSCFACPNSFSTVPTASGPVFMF